MTFRKTFKPTKEERKRQLIALLNFRINCINEEDCIECINYQVKDDYELCHKTTVGYCKKRREYLPKHCGDWELNFKI